MITQLTNIKSNHRNFPKQCTVKFLRRPSANGKILRQRGPSKGQLTLSLQSFEEVVAAWRYDPYTTLLCTGFSSNETRAPMSYYRDTLYGGLYLARLFDIYLRRRFAYQGVGRPLVLYGPSKEITGSYAKLL